MLSKTSLRCLKHVNSQPTMIKVSQTRPLVLRKLRLYRYMYLQGMESDVKPWDEETTAMNDMKVNYPTTEVSDNVSKKRPCAWFWGIFMNSTSQSLHGHSILHKGGFSQNGGSQVACKYWHVLSYQLRKHSQFYFIPSIFVNKLRTSWFCHECRKC